MTFRPKSKDESKLPVLTTIGSSNFGKRSLNRDSELVFWVYGEGRKFSAMVEEEKDRIQPFLKQDPEKGPLPKPIKDLIIDSLNLF